MSKIFQNSNSLNLDSIVYKEQTSESITFKYDTGTFYKDSKEVMFKDIKSTKLNTNTIIDTEQQNNFVQTDYGVLSLIIIGFTILAIIKSVFHYNPLIPVKKLFISKISAHTKENREPLIIMILFYTVFVIAQALFFTKLLEYSSIKLLEFSELLSATLFAIISTLLLLFVKSWNLLLSKIFFEQSLLIFSKITDLTIFAGSILMLFVTTASFLAPEGIKIIFLFLGGIVLVVMVLVEMLKFFQIIYLSKLRFYYLFLYLCIFKIMPILILVKAFFIN